MKKGFFYQGEFIKFMDPHGKDASFDRWRITLYYEPHMAKTHFEGSEADHDRFFAFHAPDCYSTYGEYRAAHEADSLKDKITHTIT